MNDPLPRFQVDGMSAFITDTDESQSADRRQHIRQMRVMRVAKLAHQQVEIEGLGVVRNISEGGMMIDAHFPIAQGQKITISLIDEQQVVGEVIWKDEQVIGIQFDPPVDVEHLLARPVLQPNGKRTRLPRLALDRDVSIQFGSQSLTATICNVSQRGAKILCAAPLMPNDDILITVENQRSVKATVRWSTENYRGVEFHRLLSVDELIQWLPNVEDIVVKG